MSSLETQLHMMQQQITVLQEQLHNATATPMQSAEDTATTSPLHSMGTRPHYDWSPSDGLTELMNLDTPLHTMAPLSDSERRTIIEAYPPMAHLDYKARVTIPTAERLMNKGQRYEDHSLKHLKYLLSAVYRPLDILAHELVSSEAGNPNLERYCTMLQDVRKLLLHVGSSMNQARNNIALRAIDPSFSMQPGTEVNYTLRLNEFQDTLIQQTAALFSARSTLPAGWFQQLQQLQQPQQPQQQLSGQQEQQQQEEHQPFSSITAISSTTSTTDPVGGRLSKYIQHWKNITTNSFVISTVQHGYNIPFHTTPTSITPFSAEQATLIDQAIQDLLTKSAIEKMSHRQVQQNPGFYSCMFVIPKKNGGVRPVFNLKRLSQYLNAPHFKMETIREVSLMIKPNDYLVSIDLSDAFLHVGLHPEPRRFLRLKWRNQVYQYCTTAFGLSSSPFVFTKVCRPILEHLRSRGFRISAYLDDWLLIANSRQQAETQARQVVSLLEKLGWIINYKKSVLTPTQQLEHLGFVLDTRSMRALLPARKLRDIRRSIKQVLDKPHRQSPRIIHSLTMRIQSATRGLGSASSFGSSEHGGTPMVVSQHQQMERPIFASNHTHPNHVCRCKQHGMRMLLETLPCTRLLDSGESSTVYQLERVKSSSFGSQDVPSSTEFHSSDTHGQHNQPLIHQQARWYSLSSSSGISNGGLDMVFAEQDYDPSTAHSRCSQQDSGFRVSPTIFQEPVDDQTAYISANTANLGSILDRSLCRPHNQAITKLRVVDAGSGRSLHGCAFHPMEQPSESLRKSPLESHLSGIEQNQAGTTSFGDSGSTVLAQCPMVSSPSTFGSLPSMVASPTGGTNDISQDSPSTSTAELDALRVATLRHQLMAQNLNAQAVEDILAGKLAPTGTNLGYRKNQLRFLDWAIKNGVSFTSFTPVDLVNFLADMRNQHHLQASTLKTLQAAVSHLHAVPKSIRESNLVNPYIDTATKQAPPVSIHRPTIDITPALAFARSIASQPSTSIKLLQQKLAFLLAMAAFLRPSDLARIPYESCSITDDGCLTLKVVAPKETRRKRRIIKPFTVHPHVSDAELCPVQCFKALRDYPSLVSRPPGSQLFVKSHIIQQPLSSSTI